MPEHDCLPPDVTATEFVTHLGRMSGLPATAAKEQAAEALRHVGLHEERYRQIGTFSTGMKQRVKLAQALVGDPGLLLLDEPTNGLDPAGRDEMLALIHRIGTEFGIAVVVASHLLSEIERICDHLVAIEAAGCCAPPRRRLTQASPAGGRGGGGPARCRRTGQAGLAARGDQRVCWWGWTGRTPFRRGPRRGRRPGTAAHPAGAPAAPRGGAVPRRGRARTCLGPRRSRRRRHPRHRLQPLHGPRLGRGQIVRALCTACAPPSASAAARRRRSCRVAFVADVPAGVRERVAVARGKPLIPYDIYAFTAVRRGHVFVAVQAPELVSRDLRSHACRCTSPGRCAAATTRWPSTALTAAMPAADRGAAADPVPGPGRLGHGGSGSGARPGRFPGLVVGVCRRCCSPRQPADRLDHRPPRHRDRRSWISCSCTCVRVPAADPAEGGHDRHRRPAPGRPGWSARSPSSTGSAIWLGGNRPTADPRSLATPARSTGRAVIILARGRLGGLAARYRKVSRLMTPSSFATSPAGTATWSRSTTSR